MSYFPQRFNVNITFYSSLRFEHCASLIEYNSTFPHQNINRLSDVHIKLLRKLNSDILTTIYKVKTGPVTPKKKYKYNNI